MASELDRRPAGHSGIRLSTETAVKIYNEGIAPRLLELDRKRRARQRSDELTWIASLTFALVVGSLAFLAMSAVSALLLALLAGGGAQWALTKRPRPDVALAMRQEIFKPLCDAAGISYALAPRQSHAESFAGFGLVGSFKTSRFENQLSGAYRDIVFLQTDARLSGREEDETAVVFHGLLSVFELKRRFSGQTLILKSDSHLEKVIDNFQERPERIDLGDWTFEQSFEVYGTDPDEARRIVTPVLRGQLLALQDRLSFDLQFAFTGSTLLMSLDLTEDALDIAAPELAPADPRRLQATMIRFQTVFETLDVLQLNPRRNAPPAF